MKKLFSSNGAFPKKAMIVGVALAVVVALSYFGSSDYLGQSIMDMLMGGTQSCGTCSNCVDHNSCQSCRQEPCKDVGCQADDCSGSKCDSVCNTNPSTPCGGATGDPPSCPG